MSAPDDLAAQITAAEAHLQALREQRDAQIVTSYQAGTSKYRLAKDWNLSEISITRILEKAGAHR